MWHTCFSPVLLSFIPHLACSLCYCYFQILKSMLSSSSVFEKSTQRKEMAGKANSPIMLNVQSLCNRAMKKIPSGTSFNIRKILQWKKKKCSVFCSIFQLENTAAFIFFLQNTFMYLATLKVRVIVKLLFHWKDCWFTFLIRL